MAIHGHTRIMTNELDAVHHPSTQKPSENQHVNLETTTFGGQTEQLMDNPLRGWANTHLKCVIRKPKFIGSAENENIGQQQAQGAGVLRMCKLLTSIEFDKRSVHQSQHRTQT